MSVFNACIVQTTSLPYDKEANLNRALAWMEQAHAKGVDLILLPEMFLTGYFVKDKLRELAFSDMQAALKLGLEMTLEHLNRQGNEVSPASREALAWLNQ